MNNRAVWAAGGFAAILGTLWLMRRLQPEDNYPYLPIEVLAIDGNNDGVIDAADEALFLGSFPSYEGDPGYRRRFDMNFDGAIIEWPMPPATLGDIGYFYYDMEHMERRLGRIRNRIKTDIATYIEWPDGWGAWLVALRKDAVRGFTGFLGSTKRGWVHLIYHDFWYADREYVCVHFATDTAVAAYKALGYGCLLYGASTPHAYNIFWTGGDWRDLRNWWIIEPQDGSDRGCALDQPSWFYQTRFIEFFDSQDPIRHIILVDFENNTMELAKYTRGLELEKLEEPFPEIWDTSLGIPKESNENHNSLLCGRNT